MSKQYSADATHIYFCYDPLDSIVFFDDISERDNFASYCIGVHGDDGWSEEVGGIITGVVQERATRCEVQCKADSPDDWPYGDIEEVCNYKMMPVAASIAAGKE